MTRSEITKWLGELLIQRINHRDSYYAREVSIDYGTSKVKRVDFIQFEPKGVIYTSDIEKGIFSCYEVKSCKEDVFSGNGLNFLGEKNYIVTTMECYKDIQSDLTNGHLWEHIRKCNPESSGHFGVIVAVPVFTTLEDEYKNPTKLYAEGEWDLKVVLPCRKGGRNRSTAELMFCMLRSGK